MKILKAIRRAYPLTVFGSLTLAGAFLLWVFSSLTENQTGMFLSIIGFVLLALFILLTHLRFAFSDGGSVSCSIAAFLHSGENISAVKIDCHSWGLPFFIRAHLRISGSLVSSGLPLFYIVREYRFSGSGECDASLFLPVGGELSVRGVFILRDVLGLTRKVIGNESVFVRTVSSSSIADLEIDVVHDSVSQDPKALNHQAETEKVFVREYVSGDLARDINWKALARIGSLLTRIPPESPRESKLVRLVVCMPPAGGSSRERGRALVQVEHIRVLVSSFLETIRRTTPEYGFLVCVGDAEYKIDPGERFDAFYAELARSGFGVWTPGEMRMERAMSEKSWIIGSASDSFLMGMMSALRAKGNRLILSRMVPAHTFRHTADVYRVPLLEAFPESFPSRSLFAALFPVLGLPGKVFLRNASAMSGAFGASDSVIEFDCGVRL